MELLQILAHMTGLPAEAVMKDFLKTANEMGIDTNELTLDQVREVLQKKLDQTLPVLEEQIERNPAH